jgi:SAM-dependent methyltransferase
VPAGWILASLARRKAHSLRLDCRGLDIVGAARGKLLDVGCGTGTFLRFARDAGWQCFGVEPDADAVWTAQAGGATILGSQLAELRGTYAGCFDVVTLSHVIEHVHDPRAVLRDCWSVLKAGGFLWIETPNVDSIGFETYRGAWRGLEPPRHLILFGSESLTGCLSSAGFERIRVLAPRDAVGYTFPRSALVRAGQLGEAGPNALSKADIRRLRLEMRSARRLVDKAPGRSEYITAVAHRPTAAPLGSGST